MSPTMAPPRVRVHDHGSCAWRRALSRAAKPCPLPRRRTRAVGTDRVATGYGSQAQGPPGYPHGLALRFLRGRARLHWRPVFTTSQAPAARCSLPSRCTALGGKGQRVMATSSGE